MPRSPFGQLLVLCACHLPHGIPARVTWFGVMVESLERSILYAQDRGVSVQVQILYSKSDGVEDPECLPRLRAKGWVVDLPGRQFTKYKAHRMDGVDKNTWVVLTDDDDAWSESFLYAVAEAARMVEVRASPLFEFGAPVRMQDMHSLNQMDEYAQEYVLPTDEPLQEKGLEAASRRGPYAWLKHKDRVYWNLVFRWRTWRATLDRMSDVTAKHPQADLSLLTMLNDTVKRSPRVYASEWKLYSSRRLQRLARLNPRRYYRVHQSDVWSSHVDKDVYGKGTHTLAGGVADSKENVLDAGGAEKKAEASDDGGTEAEASDDGGTEKKTEASDDGGTDKKAEASDDGGTEAEASDDGGTEAEASDDGGTEAEASDDGGTEAEASDDGGTEVEAKAETLDDGGTEEEAKASDDGNTEAEASDDGNTEADAKISDDGDREAQASDDGRTEKEPEASDDESKEAEAKVSDDEGKQEIDCGILNVIDVQTSTSTTSIYPPLPELNTPSTTSIYPPLPELNTTLINYVIMHEAFMTFASENLQNPASVGKAFEQVCESDIVRREICKEMQRVVDEAYSTLHGSKAPAIQSCSDAAVAMFLTNKKDAAYDKLTFSSILSILGDLITTEEAVLLALHMNDMFGDTGSMLGVLTMRHYEYMYEFRRRQDMWCFMLPPSLYPQIEVSMQDTARTFRLPWYFATSFTEKDLNCFDVWIPGGRRHDQYLVTVATLTHDKRDTHHCAGRMPQIMELFSRLGKNSVVCAVNISCLYQHTVVPVMTRFNRSR
jgi:hypothetical protein